jgi:hypothetical protein
MPTLPYNRHHTEASDFLLTNVKYRELLVQATRLPKGCRLGAATPEQESCLLFPWQPNRRGNYNHAAFGTDFKAVFILRHLRHDFGLDFVSVQKPCPWQSISCRSKPLGGKGGYCVCSLSALNSELLVLGTVMMLLLGFYPLDRGLGFHDSRHGIPALLREG